ncbi:hypothetical protein, partial [Tychonema sp. LEGE 07203]|uniref:hypothetical protein n=1 Tax=Tychonema sp. LEGE 07203 TaxID=1828671 RepID=UPI001D154FBA
QSSFYEQARCLFHKKSNLCGMGILPVPNFNHLFMNRQDACSTKNQIFVEWASCPFLISIIFL